jgi:molybdopterin-guanine dinucleotide biosynthesis protein A
MSLWNAVVLAGDRGPTDPVAQMADVSCKAATPFLDITLLERVVTALESSRSVESIIVVGPNKEALRDSPHLAPCLDNDRVTYLSPANGPSASAIRGINEARYRPTLLLTCDLPLLSGELIDAFCQSAQSQDSDFVVTAVDYHCIEKFLPAIKKTRYQFKDKQVCFANLFAVLREPGLRVIEYWQDIENSRKKPIEIIRKIDWIGLLGYKLKLLTLERIAEKLSNKVDANITIQASDVANYALDVDSADDYRIFLDYFDRLN